MHEATHSWCGNLVTNAVHNAFFLVRRRRRQGGRALAAAPPAPPRALQNEGWTMMVQRKVVARLRGAAMFDFDAMSGLHHLEVRRLRGVGWGGGVGGQNQAVRTRHVQLLPPTAPLQDSVSLFLSRGQAEFTKLVPDLTGVDPDDSFSSVPYEKGFCLLQYIQTLVRRPSAPPAATVPPAPRPAPPPAAAAPAAGRRPRL